MDTLEALHLARRAELADKIADVAISHLQAGNTLPGDLRLARRAEERLLERGFPIAAYRISVVREAASR